MARVLSPMESHVSAPRLLALGDWNKFGLRLLFLVLLCTKLPSMRSLSFRASASCPVIERKLIWFREFITGPRAAFFKIVMRAVGVWGRGGARPGSSGGGARLRPLVNALCAADVQCTQCMSGLRCTSRRTLCFFSLIVCWLYLRTAGWPGPLPLSGRLSLEGAFASARPIG